MDNENPHSKKKKKNKWGKTKVKSVQDRITQVSVRVIPWVTGL